LTARLENLFSNAHSYDNISQVSLKFITNYGNIAIREKGVNEQWTDGQPGGIPEHTMPLAAYCWR